MNEPEDDHFCNDNHRRRKRPCEVCLAQRRKLRVDRLLAEGRPTLTHQPFALLLADWRPA